MKKTLKIFGITLVSVVIVLYISFLFILPRAIKLEQFMPMIKNIAKEQANINIDIQSPKLVTTPALGIGIKTDNIKINLPDGSTLAKINGFKTYLSVPSLLLLTVKVPEVTVQSPYINLDIEKGEQYKVVRLIENIINKQKQDIGKVATEPKEPPYIVSLIKIIVPNIKIYNYQVKINDEKSGHKLTLTGDDLCVGYFNGKRAKIKTNAKFFSDDEQMITANVDINTFIPPAQPKDTEDDEIQRVEFPFVNPVLMYRNYDLKTNINAKLKTRLSKNNIIKTKGFLNVEDLTMNLSGYQLPNCYAKFKFAGTNLYTDTNLFVKPKQNLQLLGKIHYGKTPNMDLQILSEKIYFNDLIILSKAFLDTLQIKNELATITGNGYIQANTKIKTNFKRLKSNGNIIVKDGGITTKQTGAIISNANVNLLFDDNKLAIKDTNLKLNGSKLNVNGTITKNSDTNITINSEKIPLTNLFKAFAPSNIRKQYNLTSGEIKIDADIKGKLKKATANANVELNNLYFKAKDNSFILSDKNMNINFNVQPKVLIGKINNKDFTLNLPQLNTQLSIPEIDINMDNQNIILNPLNLMLNKYSAILVNGQISNYAKKPYIDLFADGKLVTSDLKTILGKQATPFISAQGTIPVKFSVKGTDKKQTIIAQIFADKTNYLSPVEISLLSGQQSIIQAKADFKGDRIRLYNTGVYTKNIPSAITNDLELNMENTKEILGAGGTITALNTSEPFINIFDIIIPQTFNAKLYAFKDSLFTVDGGLFIFGKAKSPRMRGHFRISNSHISDLYLTLKELYIDFKGKELDINLDNLILNGSDINVKTNLSLVPSTVLQVNNVKVNSKLLNVDKMMKVADTAAKLVPPAQKSTTKPAPVDIPVLVKTGTIDLKKVIVNPLEIKNTTGIISLKNNIFYLNNLLTHTFDGIVRGNINVNLTNNNLGIKVQGYNLNAEDALLKLANLKDTLNGTASFKADIGLGGTTLEEQMKSLKGKVDFKLEDGQLGPFGKIENLILAENIRESEFFKTTIGQILNSLTSVDTSHYDEVKGSLTFKDGITTMESITSLGPVLSIHIAGNMDLLANQIDMKLRGRLGSQVSDMLGPLAYLNPINLVKNTPGMNIIAAKAFFLFCEAITTEEMNAIPMLVDSNDNTATKFQVVIRGDVAKPLTLIKSFKWLAEQSEIDNAQSFASTLPEPKPEKKGWFKNVKEEETQPVEDPIKYLFNSNKTAPDITSSTTEGTISE